MLYGYDTVQQPISSATQYYQCTWYFSAITGNTLYVVKLVQGIFIMELLFVTGNTYCVVNFSQEIFIM